MGLTYLNAAMIEQPASVRQLSAFNLQAFNTVTSNLTADNFSINRVTTNLTVSGSTIIGGTLTAVDGFFDRNGNSNQWNTVYAAVCSLSSSWEESAEILPTVTNYLSTQNVLISTIRVETGNTSNQWNDTYTIVATNSGIWDNLDEILPTVTNYLSTTPNVLISSIRVGSNNTSNQWSSTYLTVSALSSTWQETFSNVVNHLSTQNILISTIRVDTGNTSHQWNDTYTVVAANSASWEESADILPTVTSYLTTTNVNISGLQVTGSILSAGTNLLNVFLLSSFYPDISSGINRTTTNLTNLTAYLVPIISTTTSNSSLWIQSGNTVVGNASSWSNVYSFVNANSSTWLTPITVGSAIDNYLPTSRYEPPIVFVTMNSAAITDIDNIVSNNYLSWINTTNLVSSNISNWVSVSALPFAFYDFLNDALSSTIIRLTQATFNSLTGADLTAVNIFANNLTANNFLVDDIHLVGNFTTENLLDLNLGNLTITGLTSLSTIDRLNINDLVVTNLTSLSTTFTTYQLTNVVTSASLLTADTIISNTIQVSSIVTPTGTSVDWDNASTYATQASLSTQLWNTAYNYSTRAALSTNLWNDAYLFSINLPLSSNLWNSAYTSISTNASNWDSAYNAVSTDRIITASLSTVLHHISLNPVNTLNLAVTANNAETALFISQTGSGKALVIEDDTNPDATPFVINSQGMVTIGYTESLNTEGYTGASIIPSLQVLGTTTSNSSLGLYSYSSTLDRSPTVVFTRSASNTIGNTGQLAVNTSIGGISWAGDDGFDKVTAASLMAEVDGVVTAQNMPTRLVVSVTPSGGNVPVERLRITSSGLIGINTTVPNHALTVAGNISATGIFATALGTSLDWNNTYTVVATNSASWEESAGILPTITNYLSTSNVGISSLSVTNGLTVVGNISASGVVYSSINTLTTSICAVSGNGATPFVMQFTNGLLTGITY
jgi:hypothetical protein